MKHENEVHCEERYTIINKVTYLRYMSVRKATRLENAQEYNGLLEVFSDYIFGLLLTMFSVVT